MTTIPSVVNDKITETVNISEHSKEFISDSLLSENSTTLKFNNVSSLPFYSSSVKPIPSSLKISDSNSTTIISNTKLPVFNNISNSSEKFHNKYMKPNRASIEGKNIAFSYTTVVCLTALSVILICALIGFITYKRLQAYWYRRHYSRVDFLIDGLYEM